MQAKIAYHIQNILGEGPVWSAEEQALYWVDIERPLLQRWQPQSNQYQSWSMPSRIGSYALREKGGAVVALEDGLYFFDFNTGQFTNVFQLPNNPDIRFNDGKCDRNGRFWAGTMDMNTAKPIAALYRLAQNGRCTQIRDGVTISNGLGWSPDNRTMYYTDTPTQTIFAYDFDLETGAISQERPFAHDHDCFPDGLTVDAQGFVWSAKWDGWKIVRYAPDGAIDQEIPLPVQRPTSCTFGGPEMNQLYITTASIGLSLTEQPWAGSILVINSPAAGLPEPKFAG